METNASVSKQARLRGGMAWILSFLLCLFLTVLSLLSLLECTLLSPGFLKKQVDKSAYTAHVIEDMGIFSSPMASAAISTKPFSPRC